MNFFANKIGKKILSFYPKFGALQWRIQDFSEEGAPTPQGAPTYDFAIFSPKLHEIERIWALGGARPSRPLRSATALWKTVGWNIGLNFLRFTKNDCKFITIFWAGTIYHFFRHLLWKKIGNCAAISQQMIRACVWF